MRRGKLLGTATALLAFAAPTAARANTYIVNSLNDDDHSAGTTCTVPCTLRDAMTAAENRAGPDVIQFSVSGTIAAGTEPTITDSLTIDATGGTPGARAIVIDCALNAAPFQFTGGTDVVKGFVIHNRCFDGVDARQNARVTVTGNYIGTSTTGDSADGASQWGVYLDAPDAVI